MFKVTPGISYLAIKDIVFDISIISNDKFTEQTYIYNLLNQEPLNSKDAAQHVL